jgi:transposase InsO family protein
VANERLLAEIRAIHSEHEARYGSPRVLDQAWVRDITYIWTAEGWAYLAVLLDLYSRRVVGWALRKSLSRDLAMAALDHALTCRRPQPGLVHHTDRGSQYASEQYRGVLHQHGARCSMSAAGNCYDNAVAESFFATLKKELVSITHQLRAGQFRSACRIITLTICPENPGNSNARFELGCATGIVPSLFSAPAPFDRCCNGSVFRTGCVPLVCLASKRFAGGSSSCSCWAGS